MGGYASGRRQSATWPLASEANLIRYVQRSSTALRLAGARGCVRLRRGACLEATGYFAPPSPPLPAARMHRGSRREMGQLSLRYGRSARLRRQR
jgi:hypothetical protein